MTRYVQITESEMDAFMTEQGYREVKLSGVNEKVYGKVIIPKVTLRVYSTIDQGLGRKCGSDAIRTLLVTKLDDGTIKSIGKSAKVLRIETWRENLEKRLNTWNEQLGPPCPKCNNHTVFRTGKKKEYRGFYGCITYPECKGTVQDRLW